ncbi:MAG: 50S ribosomal protein L24 [Candidatus Nealsonbacteria bacterium]|nr:50S ribosomal protein L24 [Candidatus Nealsonbacteria bacterium]
MKIKKNDQVLIISGKYRGKKGKVLRALPESEKITVEGANLIKKHVKPKKSGEKGQIVSLPYPFPASKVKLICPKCGKPTRLGVKIVEKEKFRICKKCKETI